MARESGPFAFLAEKKFEPPRHQGTKKKLSLFNFVLPRLGRGILE
jgi:hypothetical protein